jgi:hypothetical protein
MWKYPFPHDLRVYVIGDDRFETAYYSYRQQKYKRQRRIAEQTWEDTVPIEIDNEDFLFAVACVERVRVR